MSNQDDFKNLKVALVHDFLIQLGGAENILKEFADIFPNADIYTIVSNEKVNEKLLPGRKVINSFIQRLPFAKKFYRAYLGFMPKAIESFDFSSYDLAYPIVQLLQKVLSQIKKILCIFATSTRQLDISGVKQIFTSKPPFQNPLNSSLS